MLHTITNFLMLVVAYLCVAPLAFMFVCIFLAVTIGAFFVWASICLFDMITPPPDDE